MDASSIIDTCGGTGAVAKALGAPTNTVLYWRRRDSIPARHWTRLVELAQQNGAFGVTVSVLAAKHAAASPAIQPAHSDLHVRAQPKAPPA